MSINLHVDGSPASCRQAARQVRRLAEQVDEAVSVLNLCRQRTASDWSGSASDNFDHVVKDRIHRADELHDELDRLADGLDMMATGIGHVKDEMQRARGIATRAGIPVGAALPQPGEIQLNPGQEGPLDHAVAVATRALDYELKLQVLWQRVLGPITALTWDPVQVSAADSGSESGGHKDSVRDRMLNTVRGVLPGGPRVGPVPLITLLNPHLTQQLMLLKGVKRIDPRLSDTINNGLRAYGRGVTEAGKGYCRAKNYLPPTLRLNPALEKPVCDFADGEVAEWYADLIAESTDAK